MPGRNQKLRGVINTQHLAADAVTADKIVAGAVNADFTGDTTPADGSITGAKLAADQLKTKVLLFSGDPALPAGTYRISGTLPVNAKLIRVTLNPGVIFGNPEAMANISIGEDNGGGTHDSYWVSATPANDNMFMAELLTDLTISGDKRIVKTGNYLVTNSQAMLGAFDFTLYVQYIE